MCRTGMKNPSLRIREGFRDGCRPKPVPLIESVLSAGRGNGIRLCARAAERERPLLTCGFVPYRPRAMTSRVVIIRIL